MINTPNPDDFSTGNESKMDEGLLVRFYYKEVQDKEETLEKGRPIFKETEYVEIRIPGKRDIQAARPASYADKQRFSRHYEAFKKRVEAPKEGTPLEEWPMITRSQAEELSFLHVKTVEQLVAMSDNNLSSFMGGYGLQRKAKEWLEASSETALIAEKEALQDKVDKLIAQVEDLTAKKNKPEVKKAKPAAKKETEKVVEKVEEIEVIEAEEVTEDLPGRARRSRNKKGE